MTTQYEIAQALGLSAATVANIISGREGLRYSQATRERVLKAASEMNYKMNRTSRALRTGRSNLIAIVHFGAGIEAAHKANRQLSHFIRAEGYDYLSVDMNWHEGSVERALDELIQARVEGVLISHIQEMIQQEHLAVLARAGIPAVAINGEPREDLPLVCDNISGAFQQLTEHLIGIGHRQILHLTKSIEDLCPQRTRNISQRTLGFREAFMQGGSWRQLSEADFFAQRPLGKKRQRQKVEGLTIIQRPNTSVYSFCKQLFQTDDLPDAIVCANDRLAMEVILAGLEYGVRIPEDLAVTGYDNDAIGVFPALGITTAEQDMESICENATRLLKERIEIPSQTSQHLIFDSTLILRTSCGRLNATSLPRPFPHESEY